MSDKRKGTSPLPPGFEAEGERFARAVEAENAEYRRRAEAGEVPKWVALGEADAVEPFIPGEELTVFEAAMIWRDRCLDMPEPPNIEDIEFWIGRPAGIEFPDRRPISRRWEAIVGHDQTACWSIACDLLADIDDGKLSTVIRHVPRNPYEQMLRLADFLDWARRRGGHGEIVGNLLAEREQQTNGAPAGAATSGSEPPVASGRRAPDWIFLQRSRFGQHQQTLYKEAKGASLRGELGTFAKRAFCDAYGLVYESRSGRPPVTGWQLCSPYKERAEEGAEPRQT
jgi:hypothetical protein